jgi:small subunit ribosomal protein S8
MLNDPLANALSAMLNAEKAGKKLIAIKPISNMIKKVLEIMNDNHYVGEMTEVKDSKGNIIKLNLLGNINNCGVIKPTYSVKKDEYEKYEKRYLISRNIGFIIVSTPQGLMTHNQAKEKGIGGKLIAYVY